MLSPDKAWQDCILENPGTVDAISYQISDAIYVFRYCDTNDKPPFATHGIRLAAGCPPSGACHSTWHPLKNHWGNSVSPVDALCVATFRMGQRLAKHGETENLIEPIENDPGSCGQENGTLIKYRNSQGNLIKPIENESESPGQKEWYLN